MKRATIALLLLLLVLVPVQARIEAPDHVLYGNVTLFGDPVATGQIVEARLMATGQVISRYELGTDPDLGDQYALRIPMDTVDPRIDGRARPGDPIRVFIGSELAAETVVGAEGRTKRLDLDPQNLGTGPSVSVAGVELFEGNAGQQAAEFVVNMNTTSDDDVELGWTTVDDTATGGASCTTGVDYLSQTSSLIIPPGDTQATISVLICGDSAIESTERFSLSLSIRRGVLSAGQAIATIIDDDDIPSLRLADIVVNEPSVGSAGAAVFRPALTKNSDFESRFAWRLQPLNAVPGTDYEDVSGTAVIEAGAVETEISVPLLHVPATTEPKSFRLVVSQPFNVTVTDGDALAVIQDPGFRPAVEHEQALVNQRDGLTRLSGPTALALSPDGDHAYVTSESLDAVLAFARNATTGHLSAIGQYDGSVPGFEGALLDAPLDVVVSPDGAHVYVASSLDDAIAVFSRESSTGALALIQNQQEGVLGDPDSTGPNAGLIGVRKLLLTADGRHLYAAGAGANAVAVFARDASDGTLAFIEAEVNGVDDVGDAGATVERMRQPSGLTLSPDGEQLYVASRGGDAIQVFDRTTAASDPDHGRLSYRTAYIDALDGISGLDGPLSLAVSGDGEGVYVSIEDGNGLWLFDRAANGALSQRKSWRHDAATLPGLRGAQGLAVSPDGLEVFVTGFADNSLTLFERMQPGNDAGLPAGDLRLRQTVFDDAGAVLNMAGPTAVVPSADDEHLYVVANTDDAIVVFRRISVDEVFTNDFE
jgi:DNA-binding beta-propeller fold protein YncE